MLTVRTRLICLPIVGLCAIPIVCLLCLPAQRSASAAAPPAAGLPPTRAGGAKDVKRTTVEVKEIERRFTKPATPTPRAKEESRPVGIEEFVVVRKQGMKRITDALITKMRSLIAATGQEDPQRPDFFFRAAELYSENRHYYFERARGLDQKIFELPPGRRGPLQAEQKEYERQEGVWLLEAVKAYINASKYPKYERMDEVLFRLGSLLTAAKKDDQAREYFHRLIKDFPNSKYIPDAYLAFAEHAFESGEMDAALKFYEKVEQFPQSLVYPYAAYKKGWCYINLGDHKTALETFVGVVRLTQSPKAVVTKRQLEVLAREAKKDIVKAYAQVGPPDKARMFFAKIGGDYAPKMMELLAERYWEDGKAPESTRIYKQIIADNMSSPRICEWQSKVLRNSLSLAAYDKALVTQELERLGNVYEKARPPKPDQAAECRNGFHDAARELALVWHREAQRTVDLNTYALADRAYRLFLANFPDDKDAYEMNFYRGELLWVTRQWKDAAEQYTRVVEMKPGGKHLRESAYAAVLSWKNALMSGDEPKPPQREPGHDRLRAGSACGRFSALPLPENQQKMIRAFHTYRKNVPDAPELPVMLYREAYIYYDHNLFDRAEPLFLEVVQKHARHELAVYAANLYLDALNMECKSKEVLATARKFLDTPELVSHEGFAEPIVSIVSDGYELEARAFDKQGDRKECGRSFLAAAEALPTHAKHAERLWNAGQCFQNAHLVGQSIKAWSALITTHPENTLAKRAQFRIGAGYQQLAFYEKAAEYYEKFAKRYPGEPDARTALGNAAAFREGLQQPREALADMDAYVGFYGGRNPQDAAGVFFQKGEVYESQGQLDELRAHLRSYLDKWGKHGGLDRQVQAHFRLGELAWKGACARAGADGACIHVQRLPMTLAAGVIEAANRKLGRSKRTQCGPATKSKTTVFDRNRQQASGAEEHFRAAIQLWKAGDAANQITGRDAEARRAAAAYAASGAAFYLAEKDYEDLLRVKFPQGLDFSRPEKVRNPGRRAAVAKKLQDSEKRFTAYLGDKTKLLEQARTHYLEVFKLRQAQWTIAAAARVGQLHQDFSGQLYTAEIPKDLPDTDAWGNHPRDLYCEALEAKAEPIEAKALEGFRACLSAATQQSWYNQWSRLCEQELNQLKPAEFPVASEIKPEAGYVPMSLAPASVTAID